MKLNRLPEKMALLRRELQVVGSQVGENHLYTVKCNLFTWSIDHEIIQVPK